MFMKGVLPVQEYDKLIRFLQLYRQFERLQLEEGYKVIKEIYKGKLGNHLCDHWTGKNRDFGSFYLNLSYVNQIRLLHYWGIEHEADQYFLTEHERLESSELPADQLAVYELQPPLFVKTVFTILLFFCNHGMAEQIYAISFPSLLPEDKQFGNASNWADYLLSLSATEQRTLLKEIVDSKEYFAGR